MIASWFSREIHLRPEAFELSLRKLKQSFKLDLIKNDYHQLEFKLGASVCFWDYNTSICVAAMQGEKPPKAFNF